MIMFTRYNVQNPINKKEKEKESQAPLVTREMSFSLWTTFVFIAFSINYHAWS